jgi:hypothetical protein
VGHQTAAVRQASNNGTTEAPQATAQEAAGNSFTQDHFIFPSPLTASARVCVLPNTTKHAPLLFEPKLAGFALRE